MHQVTNLESRVLEEYGNKKPVSSIAKDNKVSESLVHKVLAEAGITDATPTAKIISQMYADGASVGTIARELNIKRTAVEKYLPYLSSPRKPWTEAEDKIVLSGRIPEGRTKMAANTRRHRLKKSPSPVKWESTPLRTKRIAEHLTQAELANLSDVPVATIRAYEQRTRDINSAPINIIDRLAKILRCKDYREILSKK